MVYKIATNDVFHDVVLLLRLHKEKDLLINIFKAQGWNVSNAKIKSWRMKTGEYSRYFRPMPIEALEDFFEELRKRGFGDEITNARNGE